MSLVSQLTTLTTRIGTEFKAIRVLISGTGTGGVTGLNTTATNLVAAINEVKSTADSAGGGGWAAVDATDTVKGIVELATTAEVTTGTDTVRAVTPAGVAAAITAFPVASVTVQGKVELATTAEATTGTDTARAVTPAGLAAAVTAAAVPAASETVQGRIEIATLAEVAAGTDALRAVTAAGVRQERTALKAEILGAGVPGALDTLDELAAALGDDANFAASVTTSLSNKQPLDADLTAIAALASATDRVPYSTGAQTWALATFTAAGRSVVGAVDAAAQRTALAVYSTTEVGDPNTDFVAAFNAAIL